MRALLDQWAGEATIRQGDRVVRCAVEWKAEREKILCGDCVIDGLSSWEGKFTALDGTIEVTAGVLELPDGRTGRIVVTQVEVFDVTSQGDDWRGFVQGGRGDFQGTGSAPRRAA